MRKKKSEPEFLVAGDISANSTAARKNTIASALLTWFATSARNLPWRRTRDPYGIWVSEIMLQQTQVKTVIPYWERWMRELPSIRTLAQAPADQIHKLWEGLGYYTRVRNMQKAAQQIETLHNGKFPEDFDTILALSGIGRYTAGAISSIAFNVPAPILDGNVIRVLTRVYGIAENPREKIANEKLWQLAHELVSQAGVLKQQFTLAHGMENAGNCSLFNQAMMELGALICTPRQPKCHECPLAKSCVAYREGRIGSLPNLEKRAAATARRFLALVVEHDGKFLVRQRPEGVVNAHLWEFPNHEVTETRETIVQFAEQLLPGAALTGNMRNGNEREKKTRGGANAKEMVQSALFLLKDAYSGETFVPFVTIKHSITRYRITLEAFHTRLENAPAAKDQAGTWKSFADLKKLAFTSAHGKILSKLG